MVDVVGAAAAGGGGVGCCDAGGTRMGVSLDNRPLGCGRGWTGFCVVPGCVSSVGAGGAAGGGPTRVMNLRWWIVVDDGAVSKMAVRISTSCSVYLAVAMEMSSTESLGARLSDSCTSSCASATKPSSSPWRSCPVRERSVEDSRIWLCSVLAWRVFLNK